RLSNLQTRRKEAQLRRIQAERELAEVRAQIDGRWFRPAPPLPVSPLEVEKELANSTRLKGPVETLLKLEAEMDEIKRLAGPNPSPAALERQLIGPRSKYESTKARLEETRKELIPGIERGLREAALIDLRRRAVVLERQARESEELERQLEGDEGVERGVL